MATLIKGIEELLAPVRGQSPKRVVALGVHSRELLEKVVSELGAGALEMITHQATSARGWEAAQMLGGHTSVKLLALPELCAMAKTGDADAVILCPTRDRELTYFWADCAAGMLKNDGLLVLVGARNEGVEPLERRLGEKLKKVARVVVKPFGRGTLFEKKQACALPELNWGGFDGESGLHFKTLPGVFSKNHFDAGTALLIASADPKPGERVLDLGCGPGTVGLTLLARAPSLRVVLTDEDANAVACVRENAQSLGLQPEAIYLADGGAALENGAFDLVLLNPPFSAGKAVDFAIAKNLATQAKAHLSPGGRFYLLAHAHAPYEKFLRELFGSVEVVAENTIYKVWKCS
jgi:16S rRNA (guanine1207-N2)-methyltransferase